MVNKSENSPIEQPKTTRNGNKLFEGAKDGKPFKKGVPKTAEEKQAMSEGWKRRKVYQQLYDKITKSLEIRIDGDEITNKDLIEALKTIIEALGDKVSKHEIMGDLGVEKVFITPKEAKETNKHIDTFIDDV